MPATKKKSGPSPASSEHTVRVLRDTIEGLEVDNHALTEKVAELKEQVAAAGRPDAAPSFDGRPVLVVESDYEARPNMANVLTRLTVRPTASDVDKLDVLLQELQEQRATVRDRRGGHLYVTAHYQAFQWLLQQTTVGKEPALGQQDEEV